jgi:hypothetical protein
MTANIVSRTLSKQDYGDASAILPTRGLLRVIRYRYARCPLRAIFRNGLKADVFILSITLRNPASMTDQFGNFNRR